MICTVIRHAEKEQGDFYNPRLRHQDQPISEQGKHEAQKLTAFFSGKHVSAIYVSAYQRTLQTIEPVAGQQNLTPAVDDRLNEIDNGRFEGLSEADIAHTYPDAWNAFHERKADFRFPGGETGREAQTRILDFLQEKLRFHKQDHIILVSHDGLIRLLMCSVVQIPVYRRWTFQVDTCGIMEIAYQTDYEDWKLIRFNQKCA